MGGISSEGSDDPCFDTIFVCDELFVDFNKGSEILLFFAVSKDVDTTSVFSFKLLDWLVAAFFSFWDWCFIFKWFNWSFLDDDKGISVCFFRIDDSFWCDVSVVFDEIISPFSVLMIADSVLSDVFISLFLSSELLIDWLFAVSLAFWESICISSSLLHLLETEISFALGINLIIGLLKFEEIFSFLISSILLEFSDIIDLFFDSLVFRSSFFEIELLIWSMFKRFLNSGYCRRFVQMVLFCVFDFNFAVIFVWENW